MDLVSRLEARLGRFAIPGLVQILAYLQMVTLLLLIVSSPEAREAFIGFLELDPDRLLHGEVWRVVSHVFLPRTFHLFWAIIGALFLMWIGRRLDEAWGAFRVNLYVIGGIVSLTVGALVFGYVGGGLLLFQSLLFAFAMFYPNDEIMLFFVIPIKVKWLAWIGAALLAFAVLEKPGMFWQVLCANLNYLAAFGPAILKNSANRMKVMERRSRFEGAQLPGDTFLHQCAVPRGGGRWRDLPPLPGKTGGRKVCRLTRWLRGGGQGSGGGVFGWILQPGEHEGLAPLDAGAAGATVNRPALVAGPGHAVVHAEAGADTGNASLVQADERPQQFDARVGALGHGDGHAQHEGLAAVGVNGVVAGVRGDDQRLRAAALGQAGGDGEHDAVAKGHHRALHVFLRVMPVRDLAA